MWAVAVQIGPGMTGGCKTHICFFVAGDGVLCWWPLHGRCFESGCFDDDAPQWNFHQQRMMCHAAHAQAARPSVRRGVWVLHAQCAAEMCVECARAAEPVRIAPSFGL